MYPFSKNVLKIKPSPTLALSTQATHMRKEGKPIISLAVGEPDFATPEIIVQAAQDSLRRGRTKYGTAGGGLPLRKAISEKLARENFLQFDPESIVVGMGAKEILFHLMLALLNEKDEVLIPSPYWVSYADQVLAAGGRPVLVPMSESFAENPIDIDTLKQYASPKTVAFILNSPNNPSGYVLSQGQLEKLGAWLETTSWWVICDEIYEYLSFEKPHLSLFTLCPGLEKRGILVNGFSKGFAMTGWRVGYAAGPTSVIELVTSLQSHSSTCLPGFIEDAACVAAAAGLPLVKEKIALLNTRRKKAIEQVKSIESISYYPPEGAFYLFLDLRRFLGKTSSFDFAKNLLQKHFLAAVPGEAFGTPGFLRLSYAIHEEKLEEGIERLKKALLELKPC